MKTRCGFAKVLGRQIAGRAQLGPTPVAHRIFCVGCVLLGVLVGLLCSLDTAAAKIEAGDGAGARGNLLGAVSATAASPVVPVSPMPVPPGADTSDSGTSVRVTARVKAARLLVVDDKDRIIAIYSNTGVAEESTYRLVARRNAPDGPPLDPLPERVLSAYRRLEDRVDWSVRGLVFSSR